MSESAGELFGGEEQQDFKVHTGGIFHTPCAFNPEGVSEQVCRETTKLPVRNRGCCSINCSSRARACRVCVGQSGEPSTVRNPRTGLCAFHAEHGESAVRPQKAPAPPAQRQPVVPVLRPAPAPAISRANASIKGRDILERVRRAMSESTLVTLHPSRIRAMPGQPRKYFDPVRLQALADSLTSYGQIMPGIIRSIAKDSFGHDHELLDGERRWRAANVADIPYRALLVDIDDEAAPFVVSVIANFNRAEHTTLEIADAVKVMLEELRLSQAEIGEAMGYHPVVISRFYGLRRLNQEVRDMLDPNLNPGKKVLPRTAAFELALLPSGEQTARARQLLAGTITMSDLRDHVATQDRAGHSGIKTELGERWRSMLRRAEAIEGKTSELVSLIRRTPIPENYVSSSSVVVTKRVLQKIAQMLADDALALLESVRQPE